MDKKSTLFFTSLLIGGVGSHHLAAQQQIPNGGFEQWETRSQFLVFSGGVVQGVEPAIWNSFLTAITSDASAGMLYAFANDQLKKSTETRPGSKGLYSAHIFSTSTMNIVANGNLTTGAINMGSMTPAADLNYNFTDLRDEEIILEKDIVYKPAEHRLAFEGKPDSVSVWVKFKPASDTYKPVIGGSIFAPVYGDPLPCEAQLSFILHDNYSYKEPHATEEEKTQYLVGSAFSTLENSQEKWLNLSIPFEYPETQAKPRYILASFTTNKNPGGGNANDNLWVDDLHFIYNTKLRGLSLYGNDLIDFNEDVYEYRATKKNGKLPSSEEVVAVAYGKNATVFKEITNEKITITVNDETSADAKTRVYTVYFTEQTVAPTLTIPTEMKYGEVAAPATSEGIDLRGLSYIFSNESILRDAGDGKIEACGVGSTEVIACYKEDGLAPVYVAPVAVTVKRAPLTIKAADYAYQRGTTLPANYAFVYEGLCAADLNNPANIHSIAPKASCEVQKTAGVGEIYPIHVTPGETFNYEIKADPTEGLLTVIKTNLKVGVKAISRAEGAPNPEFTITYSGFVNSENATTPGVFKTLPIASCENGNNARAGDTLKIMLSGGVSDLYELDYQHGDLAIKKAPGKIEFSAPSIATYGEENFTLSAKGGYEGATIRFSSSNSKILKVNSVTGVSEIKGCGAITLTAKISETNDYVAAEEILDFSVERAPLIVAAQEYTRKKGEENPLFELNYHGLVKGETPETAFTTLPTATCEADENSEAGIYPIIVDKGEATNYLVTPVNGKLTITVASSAEADKFDEISIYSSKDGIYVRNNVNREAVYIYNLLGKLIDRSNATEIDFTRGISSNQVYIIKVGSTAKRVTTR